jgi:hypothetical protein
MSQTNGEKKKKPDLLKSMDYLGKRLLKLGVIEHVGALSQINFQNAMTFINKNILHASRNREHGHLYLNENLFQFSKRLHDLSQFS